MAAILPPEFRTELILHYFRETNRLMRNCCAQTRFASDKHLLAGHTSEMIIHID